MNNKKLLDYFIAHSPCKVNICVNRKYNSTHKMCQACNYGCYLKRISIRFEVSIKHQLTTFIHEFAHYYIDQIIDDKKHELYALIQSLSEETEEEIAELVTMMWLKHNKKFFFIDWLANWILVFQWSYHLIQADNLSLARKIFNQVQLMTMYAENGIQCHKIEILD